MSFTKEGTQEITAMRDYTCLFDQCARVRVEESIRATAKRGFPEWLDDGGENFPMSFDPNACTDELSRNWRSSARTVSLDALRARGLDLSNENALGYESPQEYDDRVQPLDFGDDPVFLSETLCRHDNEIGDCEACEDEEYQLQIWHVEKSLRDPAAQKPVVSVMVGSHELESMSDNFVSQYFKDWGHEPRRDSWKRHWRNQYRDTALPESHDVCVLMLEQMDGNYISEVLAHNRVCDDQARLHERLDRLKRNEGLISEAFAEDQLIAEAEYLSDPRACTHGDAREECAVCLDHHDDGYDADMHWQYNYGVFGSYGLLAENSQNSSKWRYGYDDDAYGFDPWWEISEVGDCVHGYDPTGCTICEEDFYEEFCEADHRAEQLEYERQRAMEERLFCDHENRTRECVQCAVEYFEEQLSSHPRRTRRDRLRAVNGGGDPHGGWKENTRAPAQHLRHKPLQLIRVNGVGIGPARLDTIEHVRENDARA